MPRRALCTAATLCIAAWSSACAPAATPVPVPHGAAECVVVDDTARPRITIAAAPDGVDPFDRSPAVITRMAGAQLHETLVRITCDGRVAPALAHSWSTSDSIHWRFRTAQDRRFTDGTPIDAHSILAAWSTARTPLLAGVTTEGRDIVVVTLHERADVRILALPALTVVRRSDGDAWAAGTGRYRVDTSAPDRTLRLITRSHADDPAMRPDTLDFRTFAGDMRAAIDDGVDVLIARDAATLAYARARSDYDIAPLPWNRTWILASLPSGNAAEQPGGAGGRAGGRAVVSTAAHDSTIAASFTEGLLGVPVRAPVAPHWWTACSVPAPAAAGRTDARVLYDRRDPTARTIAERVAALARGRAPAWLRDRLESTVAAAVGVSEPELIAALRNHTSLAVVVAMSSWQFNSCSSMSPAPVAALEQGWRITPLIETRDALVYRPGIGRVTVDRDGVPRFGEPRTRAAGAR